MATGIPAQAPCRNEGTYEITYPGKLSVTEIIAGHRAELLAIQRKGAEGRLHCGENLDILLTLLDDSEICGKVDLIYIDPPFNTGKTQSRTQISTVRDDNGDRVGFQGKRYRTIRLGTQSYTDTFDDHEEMADTPPHNKTYTKDQDEEHDSEKTEDAKDINRPHNKHSPCPLRDTRPGIRNLLQ
jgi:hypothetical protein